MCPLLLNLVWGRGQPTHLHYVERSQIFITVVLPMAMISYKGRTFSNQLEMVRLDNGVHIPTFSCSSSGVPQPTNMWETEGTIPSGVMRVNSTPTQQDLVWTRPVNYTDAERYICTAQNNFGSSITILELTVDSKSEK